MLGCEHIRLVGLLLLRTVLGDYRFVKEEISKGLSDLLLEEVVVEDEQAHWLHPADEFIEISIEECLFNVI